MIFAPCRISSRLLSANGEPNLVEKVKKGFAMGGKTFKVHLDGVNPLAPSCRAKRSSPRAKASFKSDDGECMAVRMGRFKIVFAEQRQTGLDVWREPLSPMRLPKFFHLRADPFERGEESFKYNGWFVEQNHLLYSAPPMLGKWLEKLQGVPAPCEGGELQHRPGRREVDAEQVDQGDDWSPCSE